MIGGWNGRRPTLLGLLNRLAWFVFDRGIVHDVEDYTVKEWHPWWHGTHKRGTWRVCK